MKYLLLLPFLFACGGKGEPPLTSKECNELLEKAVNKKYSMKTFSQKDLACEKEARKCVVFCENTCDKTCMVSSISALDACANAGLITE